MKIVIIGGTDLIGSKSAAILRQGGHEIVAASPNSSVNAITGEGVKEAVAGAQVVIDLANSLSFEDKAVLEFFETSGHKLLAAKSAAGVRHHVALSIVGTDRTPHERVHLTLKKETVRSPGSIASGNRPASMISSKSSTPNCHTRRLI